MKRELLMIEQRVQLSTWTSVLLCPMPCDMTLQHDVWSRCIYPSLRIYLAMCLYIMNKKGLNLAQPHITKSFSFSVIYVRASPPLHKIGFLCFFIIRIFWPLVELHSLEGTSRFIQVKTWKLHFDCVKKYQYLLSGSFRISCIYLFWHPLTENF